MDGPHAIFFEKAKIELLCPALVVAVAKPGRLSHLTDPFTHDKSVDTFDLEPLACCEEKSRQQRQRWRQQLFAEWLSGSQNQQIGWQDRSVINLPDRNQRLIMLAPPEADWAPIIQFGCLRLKPDGTALPGRSCFL